MATPVMTETRREEEEERRRKRALALIADIRRRLDMVCPQVQRIDRGADVVSEVIEKTRELASLTGARDLLPAGVRSDLADAADRFDGWRTRVGDAAGLCERLYGALDEAERVLSARAIADDRKGRRRLSKVVSAGVVVVAVVAAVVLSILLLDDDDPVHGATPSVTTVPVVSPSAPAAQPDLIAKFEADPKAKRQQNRTATSIATVTVTNTGEADAGPFVVAVWEQDNSGKLQSVTFQARGLPASGTAFVKAGLPAGESITLTGIVTVTDEFTDFGPVTLVAEVDSCDDGPPCMVAERDEANNLSNAQVLDRIVR